MVVHDKEDRLNKIRSENSLNKLIKATKKSGTTSPGKEGESDFQSSYNTVFETSSFHQKKITRHVKIQENMAHIQEFKN